MLIFDEDEEEEDEDEVLENPRILRSRNGKVRNDLKKETAWFLKMGFSCGKGSEPLPFRRFPQDPIVFGGEF